MSDTNKYRRSSFEGHVISDKMDKTITVEVTSRVGHDRYGKFVRRSTICKAHDEKNEAKAGDKVRIETCRPMSRTKRWKLSAVIERKSGPEEVVV